MLKCTKNKSSLLLRLRPPSPPVLGTGERLIHIWGAADSERSSKRSCGDQAAEERQLSSAPRPFPGPGAAKPSSMEGPSLVGPCWPRNSTLPKHRQGYEQQNCHHGCSGSLSKSCEISQEIVPMIVNRTDC